MLSHNKLAEPLKYLQHRARLPMLPLPSIAGHAAWSPRLSRRPLLASQVWQPASQASPPAQRSPAQPRPAHQPPAGQHQLRPKGAQQHPPLRAHRLRHRQHQLVALGGCDVCQAHACRRAGARRAPGGHTRQHAAAADHGLALPTSSATPPGSAPLSLQPALPTIGTYRPAATLPPPPTRVARRGLHQNCLVRGDEPLLLRFLHHAQRDAVLDCSQQERQRAGRSIGRAGGRPGKASAQHAVRVQGSAADAAQPSPPELHGSMSSSLHTMSAKHISFTLFSRTCRHTNSAGQGSAGQRARWARQHRWAPAPDATIVAAAAHSLPMHR